jgi:hypothetical protein
MSTSIMREDILQGKVNRDFGPELASEGRLIPYCELSLRLGKITSYLLRFMI